jgi:hypothetical protein
MLSKPNKHIRPRHAVGDVIKEEDRKRCEEERPADQFVALAVIRHKTILKQLMAERQR